MRILLSNDDGIASNGIRALSEALSAKHEVYIIAPDRERSAAGHSLTLHTPLRVEKLDEPVYKSTASWVTTGTPGDCVKIAISAVLGPDEQPDLIISGINHGPNLGSDILYSGTVSCAMKGAMLVFPVSQCHLQACTANMKILNLRQKFITAFVDKKLKEFKFPHKCILNINVPSVNEDDIGGIAITKLGKKCLPITTKNVLTLEAKFITGGRQN